MTSHNQASGAAETTTEEVVKTDPTLATIRGEREEAAAEVARRKAEREERQRIATKRSLLGEVLNMQADIDKRYEAVKEQKKLLKSLRNDLKAIENEDELSAEDLKELIKRGYDAFNVKEGDLLASGGVCSRDAFPSIIVDALKLRGPLLDLKFHAG